MQAAIVELGGEFTRTTGLNWYQWLSTIGMGAFAIPVGILMRVIPICENPKTLMPAQLGTMGFGGFANAEDELEKMRSKYGRMSISTFAPTADDSMKSRHAFRHESTAEPEWQNKDAA